MTPECRATIFTGDRPQVAIGRFTAKDLHLPVQLYDPLDHYRAVTEKLIGFGPD
jgi:hypothetical protein